MNSIYFFLNRIDEDSYVWMFFIQKYFELIIIPNKYVYPGYKEKLIFFSLPSQKLFFRSGILRQLHIGIGFIQ